MFNICGINLINDIKNELEEIISIKNKQNYENIKRNKIVLTGSTGFLGIHILKELLEQKSLTHCEVYLVIRANSINESINKLKTTWKKYINNNEITELSNEFINNNLNIILGDISKKNWDCEIPENSILIHSAGIVNTIYSKNKLKNNYLSLINISEQIIYKNVYLMFISTLSVYVSTNHTTIGKEIVSNNKLNYYGGYSQTKFMAENIVELFPNYQIIRPSLLTGSTFNYKFPELDYFKMFINIINRLKCKPKIENESFLNFVPVDIASKKIISEIIKISNKENVKKILHISNPNKTSIKELLDFFKYEEIEIKQFLNKLKNLNLIEKQLLINSINFNNEMVLPKIINKYFNINLFQGNLDFESDFSDIDNGKLIEKYIISIINS
jgi:thioester reductase-like protein